MFVSFCALSFGEFLWLIRRSPRRGTFAVLTLLFQLMQTSETMQQIKSHLKTSESLQDITDVTPPTVGNCEPVDRMVVVAKRQEGTEWIPLITSAPVVIYEKEGTNTSNEHVVPNFGNEASTFIKFIIDNYDCLPKKTAFVHAHRTSWHTGRPMDEILNTMDWDRAEFFKLPSDRRGQTEVAKYPADRSKGEDVPIEIHIFWLRWLKQKYGPAPERIDAACCAQFVVSRERILLNSKAWYTEVYEWLISEEIPTYWSGRALEFSWHMLFGENPIEPVWDW
ncbi:hypothetical protein HKX48_005824 [Thoreauomyces humboldtii]|nr:hypothetical protein HKX48_005824 [Thoreauomyces humboldtii]